MGFMDIFRKKEGEITALPFHVKQLSDSLSIGQMVPIRTDLTLDGAMKPFLSFLVKESDECIGSLRNNPNVEVSFGGVTFNLEKKIFVLYFLVRLDERPEMTYETAFSLAEAEMQEDCETLSNQDGIQVIVSGKSESQVIIVKMESIHQNVGAVINMTKDITNLDWSIEEFMECVGFIQSQTSNPNELWDLLQNAGGFIEINGQ
ncbi:hypothetical protein [Vibrio splendidus]|uniref:hypothetical protein n=1 Tax=Vibrio splendidus TaxID=29497 RepID=UPI0006CA3438|nr:hypothetical protein [Vibrio splendidus]KPM00440.1 hypothetical protein AN167_07505 [Vibrio splendidus]